MYGISEESVDKLITVAFHSIDENLKKAKEAFKREDLEELRVRMHTVKNNFASLGFKDLYIKSEEIEKRIREREQIDYRSLLEEVMILWRDISDNL